MNTAYSKFTTPRRHHRPRLLAIFLSLAVASFSRAGLGAFQAQLTGTVTDAQTGAPVENAKIQVNPVSEGGCGPNHTHLERESNGNGFYTIARNFVLDHTVVPYELCVRRTGYRSQTVDFNAISLYNNEVDIELVPEGTVAGPAPALVASVLPGSRSVQVSGTATAYGMILNAGDETAVGCSIGLTTILPFGPASTPAHFKFQATDALNNLIGTANTPVDIPAQGAQSFLFEITTPAPFPPTEVRLAFDCANSPAAQVIPGLNTLLLSASSTPVPDIIALTATLDNDGIVKIPGTNGLGAFAIASVNVGAAGMVSVTADTGNATMPVSIALCETNPVSGLCANPVEQTTDPVSTTFASNGTATFTVFVTASGAVPLDPANNRIILNFSDAGGAIRGSTSVAVQTQ